MCWIQKIRFRRDSGLRLEVTFPGFLIPGDMVGTEFLGNPFANDGKADHH